MVVNMIKTIFRKYTVTTDDVLKSFNIEGTLTALLVDGVYLVVKTTRQDSAVISYKISPREFMSMFKWTGDDARFIWEESKGGIIIVEVTEMSLEGDP